MRKQVPSFDTIYTTPTASTNQPSISTDGHIDLDACSIIGSSRSINNEVIIADSSSDESTGSEV